MKTLLIFCLTFAVHANAQTVEFTLPSKETDSILKVLHATYAKLHKLPEDRKKTSNVNSFDTKWKLIDGKAMYLTVDSCSEEGGSSMYFTRSVSQTSVYPMEILCFIYNPWKGVGMVSMFKIERDSNTGPVYEQNKEKVKREFKKMLGRIEEFF